MTHKFAKYFILAISALGLSALPALADSPCPSGDSLQYFLTNFSGTTGCTVGALDFSEFNYNNGGTPLVAASNVGVSPTTVPDGPGLNFDPAMELIGANLAEDIDVGFTVTDSSGLISDIYIDFGNVNAVNGGNALYTEEFCLTSTSDCSLYVDAPVTAATNVVQLSNTAIGGPVSSLTIEKDLDLSTNSNAAAISAVSLFGNEYSSVPEPRAVSLVLGLGLLAGFAFFKRRRVAQN